MRRWLLWVPLLAFAVLAALFAWRLPQETDNRVRSRLIGQSLPTFTLPPMIAGRPGVSSAGFERGGPRLLNIFGSWCIPCVAEAPQLAQLKARGVPIDAIAIRDTPAAVAQFLNDYGDPYVGIGDDRSSGVQLALGSSGVPETFVIGRDGRIAYQHIGAIRDEDVPMLLSELDKAR